jgi:hypothetical protein
MSHLVNYGRERTLGHSDTGALEREHRRIAHENQHLQSHPERKAEEA